MKQAVEMSNLDLTALEALAKKVAQRNDCLHGDPQYSPYQWQTAADFAVAIQSLITRLKTAEAERNEYKWRLYGRRVTESNHGTHCGIWGADGQGSPIKGADLHCTCGALENFERKRAEAAEARAAGLGKRVSLLESGVAPDVAEALSTPRKE